jgi:hypothetical protein
MVEATVVVKCATAMDRGSTNSGNELTTMDRGSTTSGNELIERPPYANYCGLVPMRYGDQGRI